MNAIFSALCNLPMLIAAILGIGFLIFFHELGHFLFAKLFGVHIPSFSIGMGPRLIEKKIGDTNFVISAIPLGGYVEIAGSPEVGQGEQSLAHDRSSGSFNVKPYWQKMVIISGGILFNMIFAYLALTALAYFGAPCITKWCDDSAPIVYNAFANMPAGKAGLKYGDKIIAVDNQSVKTITDLTNILKTNIGKEVTLEVERNSINQKITLSVESQDVQGIKEPLLGVSWYTPPVSFTQAFINGWKSTAQMTTRTFQAIAGLTKGKEKLGGPLMLISQVTKCVGLGFKIFLWILAFVSVNLAVFNVLPLPIFDGGQALFYTIEAIIGRPLSDKIRYQIHYWTWILVMALVIYLTYKDIFSLLGLSK